MVNQFDNSDLNGGRRRKTRGKKHTRRKTKAVQSGIKRWSKAGNPSKRASRVTAPASKNGRASQNIGRNGSAGPVAPNLETDQPFEPRAARLQHSHATRVGKSSSTSLSQDKDVTRSISQILGRLPRARSLVINRETEASPPMMRLAVPKASLMSVMSRLRVWLIAAMRWYAGRAVDRFRGRDTDENQAMRARRIIEGIGGTAVKIGQQMAMRIDLLPYAYGVELSKMLDKAPKFPTHQAIEAIERQIGSPLAEVFQAFDPEPIGSASIACVYQAVLKTGEKVAVKVRRPGIERVFVADCRALSWLLGVLEFLNVIRPGLSHNFLHEFRSMLLEELDFVKEARYTELFRRRIKKNLRYVTAPRVFFKLSGAEVKLSGPDVLVIEFVSGVWLGEIIAAVEHKDENALAYLREMHIYPRLVAKRLIRINQFGIFENLLFHADPHPSNVLVRPGSNLVLIDFGSCGAYSDKERYIWRQLAYYHHKEDIGRMVDCALAILEPLPPIDIDAFSKRLEAVFWQDLYAFKSKHSDWYERTSAKIWISFLNLAREFDIPMNLNTLRMIRSTLLYETVAARMYNRVNAYREHRIYNRSAGKRARKRVQRSVHKRLFEGLSNTDYLAVEQLLKIGNRLVFLTQRVLDAPLLRFSMLIGKAVYTVTVLVKALVMFFASSFALAVALNAYRYLSGRNELGDLSLFAAVREVIVFKPYLYFVLFIVYVRVHRILFRLFDKEVTRGSARY